MEYSIHYKRQLNTGTNIERKRVGAQKVTNAVENKQLIIESERHRRKTALELLAEQFDSSQCYSIVKINLDLWRSRGT